jgi:hypothetical protein
MGALPVHEIWAYLAGFGYTLLISMNWSGAELRYADALFVAAESRSGDRSSAEP